MTVGLLGTGPLADERRRALSALPEVTLADAPSLPDVVDVERAEVEGGLERALSDYLARLDVAFVAVPAAFRFRVAVAVIRQGRPAFLEGPPAASVSECATLVRVAEEAGVEVGVSQPLRFHPDLPLATDAGRPALILLHRERTRAEAARPPWTRWLTESLALCCALARSHSVQRVDAEAVRHAATWPDAVAFGLRFHSGTYAQVSLRHTDGASRSRLFLAGGGAQQEIDLHAADAVPLLQRETRAFLDALTEGRPAPVSALDALHTLRLTERMMAKLR